MKTLTLGSLFDGSGGFPLAGALCGIQPLWASEIEPYPIAVTRSRFPHMQHLGNITEINGGDIPPVDIIAFGSPCQDVSVAGKRAGMQHTEHGADDTTRSGLFYEAVRIIKEMRKSTNDQYPSFAIWENVPGAFTSNKGEDFRCVLQALQEVCGRGVSVPRPADGKWTNSGEVLGDGCSTAWRVLNAQHWGVPQRRRRIYLVADFAGGRAGEILFERQGLYGDTTQGGKARQGAATDAQGSTGRSSGFGETGIGYWQHGIQCLRAEGENRPSRPSNVIVSIEGQGSAADAQACYTLKAAGCLNPWDIQSGRLFDPSGVFHALQACERAGQQRDGVVIALHIQQDPITSESVTPCIGGQGQATAGVVYALQGNGIDRADTEGCNGCGWREKARSIAAIENCSPTLKSCSGGVPSVVFPTIARTLTAEADASPCVDRGQNVVVYALDPLASNSMKSANPHSGFHEASIAKCVDTSDQNPSKNQGGMCVVTYDGRGNGNGAIVSTIAGDHEARPGDHANVLCYQMQAYGAYGDAATTAGTMKARDHKDATDLIVSNGKPPRRYIVRRLTPVECQRLQGFPDGWGIPDKKAAMEEPDAAFWESVRKSHAEVTNKRYTPCKTREALAKWYNKLCTDSAQYKMWGNGIALPCALYVLQGIAQCTQEEGKVTR